MERLLSYLEVLLPEMEAFGESIARALPGVTCRTFSHRHADCLHCLGLSCFPAGSDELDERCVALIVSVIDHGGFTIRGYVQWQAPSFHHEAETVAFDNPSSEELAAFGVAVRRLFGQLQAAAQRGQPPKPTWGRFPNFLRFLGVK